MSPPADADYARRAIAAKALARRNQSRSNGALQMGALAGALVGWVWSVAEPDGAAAYRKVLLSVAAGLLAAVYIHAIRTRRKPPPQAACPACGHDWEIRKACEPTWQIMLQWDKCPGCGALMGDERLQIAVARSRGYSGLALARYLDKQHQEQT
ncbi:MAG: hypothetical protein PHW25_13900 [Zoogloea sp.]|uniref:hypothetical protein n=1 Tax=Zoogloea sp. TaxID=49181 RepID=UPI0026282049|nr:hypothetical protein [Zoogloea sp.]MDD3328169.1 hypothetical protein [Zoogloea sp.]